MGRKGRASLPAVTLSENLLIWNNTAEFLEKKSLSLCVCKVWLCLQTFWHTKGLTPTNDLTLAKSVVLHSKFPLPSSLTCQWFTGELSSSRVQNVVQLLISPTTWKVTHHGSRENFVCALNAERDWDPYQQNDIDKLETSRDVQLASSTKTDYKDCTPGCVTNMLRVFGLQSLQNRRKQQQFTLFFKIVKGWLPQMNFWHLQIPKDWSNLGTQHTLRQQI